MIVEIDSIEGVISLCQSIIGDCGHCPLNWFSPCWKLVYQKEGPEVRRKIEEELLKSPEMENSPKIKTKEYISAAVRWLVWERDNFTCRNCGKRKNLTIDHIIPESKGGQLKLSNLQTLCNSCNSKKGVAVNG